MDCLNNEQALNSQLTSNSDSISNTLNSGDVVSSTLDTTDRITSTLSSVDDTTSQMGNEEPLNSVLDQPTIHKYVGGSTDNIIVEVDNVGRIITATLKPIRFKTVADFPVIGSDKLIYIDASNNSLYSWDSATQTYSQLVAGGGGGESYDDTELRNLITGLEENKASKTEVAETLSSAKGYTDTKVAELIDSAPETLDTFKEIADAFKENDAVLDALNSAIGNKADKTALATTDAKVGALETDNATNKADIKELQEQIAGSGESEAGGGFMPVGSIFASAIPQTDARVHLLDGSTISQSGMYADFATLLKSLISSGYKVSCTYSEYQSDIDNYGQCGKFVIDNNAGTIKLPKITKFVEGLTNLANIGKSFSAGLPNITGNLGPNTFTSGEPFDNGTALSGNGRWSGPDGQGWVMTQLSFDASKSNAIYGKSTTVQPQSTAYPYYIVLAGGYKSAEQVDIDKVANDVNTNANAIANLETTKLDKTIFNDFKTVDLIYDTPVDWAGTFNFTKNISQYRFLIFQTFYSVELLPFIIPTSGFMSGGVYNIQQHTPDQYRYAIIEYVNATQFRINGGVNLGINKVWGVK